MRKALFVVTAACALWLAPGALASGWCGTGESAIDRPDVVTGAQVHAIVATPSDSPDLFGADANRLADDVASMTGWWTGQDPTRVPRYDLATFPGGTCLDISFVRLSQPGLAYENSSAFRQVSLELLTDGFIDEFKDYVVYYDGPSVQDNICGTGAGEFDSGGAYAIVWLNGCTDIPSDGIETHELLHAFGALPLGAPNACTAATDPAGVADTGHPCDSPTDVLYPYASGQPLSQLVLDYNHDDYYAHSGSWPDIQDSIFLQHLNAPQVPLGVTLSGAGQVTSDLPGVNCTSSCTTQWDQGTAVTLAATPGDSTRFVHWAGGCVGKADCQLNLAQAASVTAVFGPLRIPVRISTSGKGNVTCAPKKCAKTFSAGDRLTLRAVPAKGWKFVSWTGGCTGSHITCAPKTDFALAVHASFKKKR
jgi:hypothetical protein